jgi:hypothetical protein
MLNNNGPIPNDLTGQEEWDNFQQNLLEPFSGTNTTKMI